MEEGKKWKKEKKKSEIIGKVEEEEKWKKRKVEEEEKWKTKKNSNNNSHNPYNSHIILE